MIGRIEIDNDYPGYFGLREGGILAVRAGLGSSSIGGDTPGADERRALHSQVFRKTDDYYVVACQRLAGEPANETPQTPIWFDAVDEGEMVLLGLKVYERHKRLPSEMSDDESMKLQIASTMYGSSYRDQIVDQILSAMQAEDLSSQIKGFRQSLSSE